MLTGQVFQGRITVLLVLLVTLSACSSRQAPAPVVDIQASVPLKDRVKTSIKGTEYIVKKGETLYSIAWRADVDVRTIAKLNNISSPFRIYPGQKLRLTKKSSKASRSKGWTKKSNKSSGKTSTKERKKAVAQKKKQEYGKTVSGQKVNKKGAATTKANSTNGQFSQKVKRWQWPFKGKVIKTFSSTRQGSKGIDIAGRRGDKIRAAAAGKVVYVGNALRGYGNLIIIKHNEDYLSAYAHNDKLLVKEQQQVKVGQVIAEMGDSGSDRVMLHFEVRFRGKSVNPLKYLPRR